MHSVPGLVEQAVNAGVVNAESALNGGLIVLDESRTNHVHVLQQDGVPIAYAKQGGWAAHADGDDPVAAERKALALLANSGLTARLLPIGSADVLWTEALQPCTVLYRMLRSAPPAKLITAARTWGAALAELHRWPTRFGAAPAASRPWIFRLDETPPHLDSGSPTADTAMVLAELRANRSVRYALAAAEERWSERHLIHGDATTANAVVRSRGPYRWRVWFVDLEYAGLGDPSWDLATAYDSLQFFGIGTGRDVRAALGALLDGYRSESGPGRLTRTMLIARAALTTVQVAAANDGRAVPSGPSSMPLLRRVGALAAVEPTPFSPREARRATALARSCRVAAPVGVPA
jgi:aminoglycoside phosphotransferase